MGVTEKHQKAECCCRLSGKGLVSGSERLVGLCIHGAQSPPKPFLMGGVISIFQTGKPRAERKLGLSTPAPPPNLGGQRVSRWRCHRRRPGLLLPNPSFISQTVLPLGAFWRGSCCGNEPQSKLWSLGFKGLHDFLPPASSHHHSSRLPLTEVFTAAGEPAGDGLLSMPQGRPLPISQFPFLSTLFSFWSYWNAIIWILDNTWGDFLLYPSMSSI